ncbi:MAG: polysaccharide deacetylase family protein [Candidatus Phosphoribacter sp.]
MSSNRQRLELGLLRAKVRGMGILERTQPSRVGSISSVLTNRPVFTFTFDDGPTRERTPDVMQALREHEATATFFVLMRNARAEPSLLAELVSEGHEIGLHGEDHRALSTVPAHEFRGLLRSARAELQDLTGQPVCWYRPPYGRITVPTWRLVYGEGMAPVIWNRTAWDWKHTDQESRIAAACIKPSPGVVILAHDGHAGPLDLAEAIQEPQFNRRELVSHILADYSAHGLRSRTLGEVIAGGRPIYRTHFRIGRSSPLALKGWAPQRLCGADASA